MEKVVDVNFNIITGIFYSQHTLDVDHDSIKDEVINSRKYPNMHPSSTKHRGKHFEENDVHHTFYEDTNLYDMTARKLLRPIQDIVDGMFGKDMLICNEIWGHIIYPGDQTTIHNHSSPTVPEPGLSFAYYPHVLEKGGNIHFITQVNGQNCNREHKINKGDLIMFSKDILHYTPRNGSDEIRATVSGNFVFTGEFLRVLHEDEKKQNPYWYYQGLSI